MTFSWLHKELLRELPFLGMPHPSMLSFFFESKKEKDGTPKTQKHNLFIYNINVQTNHSFIFLHFIMDIKSLKSYQKCLSCETVAQILCFWKQTYCLLCLSHQFLVHRLADISTRSIHNLTDGLAIFISKNKMMENCLKYIQPWFKKFTQHNEENLHQTPMSS